MYSTTRIQKTVIGSLAVALLLTAPRCEAADPPKPEIVPDLDKCTIEFDGRSLKIAAAPVVGVPGYTAGRFRIHVGPEGIKAYEAGEPVVPKWTAQAPAETRLVWLDADDAVAYFARFKPKGEHDFQPVTPLRVHRLALATGAWLDDLAVGAPPVANRVEHIAGILTGDGRVVVLTAATDKKKGSDPIPAGYRVACFKADDVTKALWTKEFKSAGQLTHSGAYLFSVAGGPVKVEVDVRPLTKLGKDILVCAGSVDDLVCVAADNGNPRWTVPRVWEYERGFIGPSMWQHTIGRGGLDELIKKVDKPVATPGRRNAIIGGPIVIDSPSTKGNSSIFVAVSKGPERYAEYLGNCVVYEMSSKGDVVSTVSLPRIVLGSQVAVHSNGVTWCCQGGGIARLVPTRELEFHHVGPGGSDRQTEVEWYRNLRRNVPKAWLTADPASDAIAFGNGWVIRVRAGGFVLAEDAREYRFPLAQIDLETGAVRFGIASTVRRPVTPSNDQLSRIGGARWQGRIAGLRTLSAWSHRHRRRPESSVRHARDEGLGSNSGV